jgi:RecB family exonuclease
MGGPLFSISFSKVQRFQRCRLQYFFEYLSGEPRPPDIQSPAGILGTGVHRAMCLLCNTGDPEVGRAALDAYLRMPVHESAGPGTEWNRLAFEIYENGCAAHASLASEDRWAEKETWAPFPSGGVSVYAKVDRIDRLGPDRWQVIDWKTGRLDDDEATDAQLDLAHVALRVSFRALVGPSATARTVAWNLRSGVQRVRELVRDDARATMRTYAALAKRMQSVTEFPATPGPYCRFCRWVERCPEYAPAVSGEDWEDVLEDEEADGLVPGDGEGDSPAGT